jgi:hypothetical protein
VVYRINADGFRDRSYEKPKPEGRFRIAVLGDSFTFGNGLFIADTFPKVIERELEQLLPELRVEVMNCGTGGYNTAQQIELLKWRVLPFEPDLVLIAYYVDDVFENSGMDAESDGWAGRLSRWIEARQRFPTETEAVEDDGSRGSGGASTVWGSRFLGFLASRAHRSLSSRAFLESIEEHYAADSANWRKVVRALREAVRLSNEHGFSVHLTVFPDLALIEDYPFAKVDQQVFETAQLLGITTHDIIDVTTGHSKAELTVHPADAHGSALCNRLIGERLARELVPTIRGAFANR